jgi:CheY-like chemotaxis protein
MPDGFAFRILVVDDEPSIRTTAAAILSSKGYEVWTASSGFAALAELRRALPDVVISDLTMPHMSGFELLSVIRCRFPQIAVIAMSGEYNAIPPAGLIADAFLTKGSYTPEQLFNKIAELIEQPPIRPQLKPEKAPVWVPRSETGYFVVTCTECLRSFFSSRRLR